ncbi:hypothetical protein [Massilia phyllosphaerae]|uniref:hypothetical protein n=1 Tax=Massilia phyllosphaerae TaxID=3106034 RepID=UPI002B1CBFD2|nr:hypothetical protein [Massilia sp. SGZ-792]
MGNASEIRLPPDPGPAAHAAPEKLATASPYRVVGLSGISEMVVAGNTAEEAVRPYRELGFS